MLVKREYLTGDKSVHISVRGNVQKARLCFNDLIIATIRPCDGEYIFCKNKPVRLGLLKNYPIYIYINMNEGETYDIVTQDADEQIVINKDGYEVRTPYVDDYGKKNFVLYQAGICGTTTQ